MLDNLLWLFYAHRRLHQDNLDLTVQITELRRTISDLELQLKAAPDLTTLISDFADQIYVEQAFPDGKVPESLYLTPAGAE